MIRTMFLWCALIGSLGADEPNKTPAQSSTDLVAYQVARSEAGRDSEAHVRLALWCEAHGLTAERLKHLSLAVLYNPTNALARGLMGLVAYHGKWERPDQISQAVRSDPERNARIQEYLQRRAKTPDRAPDQWKLAVWCEQNDLKQQATAHLFRVLQLDPSRDAAWKHLGYKRMAGHWDKPERVAAAKAEAQAQHRADKHWKPILETILSGLTSKDKARQAQAEKSLGDVSDARAVPMIWIIFVNGAVPHQKFAVRLLGQIDSPGSSRALALLALMSRSAEVRSNATKLLRQRDPRDFAAVLIALLRAPIKYEIRPVNGPGSQGQLVIKQPDKNVKRLYSPPSAPNVPILPGDQVSMDANGLPVLIRELGTYQQTTPISIGNGSLSAVAAMFGLPTASIPALLSQRGMPAELSQELGITLARTTVPKSIDLGGPVRGRRDATVTINREMTVNREMEIPIGQMMVDAQRTAQVAQQQLANDVQAIEDYNAPIAEMNQRVRQVLTDSIGIDYGPEKLAWEKWLVDLSGYAYSAPRSYDDKPTMVEEVPLPYQPQAQPLVVDRPIGAGTIIRQVHYSCFGAGTLVRTLDGTMAIEKIRAGDLVLTQDPKTGELNYQPVVTAYHNPPNATLRIDLGTETIVATGIHRLWKAGRGWVMARELKPGDALRTMGGLAVVKSVEKEQVQPVFNLQVAEGESFFVGGSGVLAHDNSLVSPTPSPFDTVPELEKSAKP
jgi:hypothetical protein